MLLVRGGYARLQAVRCVGLSVGRNLTHFNRLSLKEVFDESLPPCPGMKIALQLFIKENAVRNRLMQ